MTYPDRQVHDFLRDHFVFHQIDVSKRDPSLKELFLTIKPFWAPLFRATSAGGTELRRWFGFFTPADLIAELNLVLAHDLMLRREEEDARELLRSALSDYPDSPASPEIAFWLGVAAFKAGGSDFDALERIWNDLIARWPASTWAARADVLEMRRRAME